MSNPSQTNTIIGLVDRLDAYLTTVLVDVRLSPPDGSDARPPIMVAGWLPPPRSVDDTQPPFIVIRPAKGSDGDRDSRLMVYLHLQTWAEDVQGWRDLANLIQRIRGALTGTRTLGPFHLELPLDWEIYDEQAQPQWAATITTTWTQPSVDWLISTQS